MVSIGSSNSLRHLPATPAQPEFRGVPSSGSIRKSHGRHNGHGHLQHVAQVHAAGAGTGASLRAGAQQSSHGAALVASSSIVGGGGPLGNDAGSASGGGGLSGILHKIFNPRTLLLAGLGAAAAMVIPPLAPIGAIGGAIAGVVLSLLF